MSEILAIFGGAMLILAAVLAYLLYRAILHTLVAEERKGDERAQTYTEMKSIATKYGFKISESGDILHNRYHQSARRLDRMSSEEPLITSTQKPNPSATGCKTFTVLKSR